MNEEKAGERSEGVIFCYQYGAGWHYRVEDGQLVGI